MNDEVSNSEPSGQPPAMRASDADREKVAQVLHNALSDGRITVHELEQRLDTVYSAKTRAELEPVTADLPEGNPVTGPVTRSEHRPERATESRIGGRPGSPFSVAIMSGADRKGNWVLPQQHNSFAFWGGVEIDLRRARFAEQQSTITAVAIMGGIDITVPDDVIVEVTGIGFMGAFDSVDRGSLEEPPPDAPVVRVNGFAFWGGVQVVRKPSENTSNRRIED